MALSLSLLPFLSKTRWNRTGVKFIAELFSNYRNALRALTREPNKFFVLIRYLARCCLAKLAVTTCTGPSELYYRKFAIRDAFRGRIPKGWERKTCVGKWRRSFYLRIIPHTSLLRNKGKTYSCHAPYLEGRSNLTDPSHTLPTTCFPQPRPLALPFPSFQPPTWATFPSTSSHGSGAPSDSTQQPKAAQNPLWSDFASAVPPSRLSVPRRPSAGSNRHWNIFNGVSKRLKKR